MHPKLFGSGFLDLDPAIIRLGKTILCHDTVWLGEEPDDGGNPLTSQFPILFYDRNWILGSCYKSGPIGTPCSMLVLEGLLRGVDRALVKQAALSELYHATWELLELCILDLYHYQKAWDSRGARPPIPELQDGLVEILAIPRSSMVGELEY